MKYVLMLTLMLTMFSCTPHVTLAHDLCVKFKVSWDAPSPLPPSTLCVCTADIFIGLEAALSTMVSVPPNIEIEGVSTPEDCQKKEPVAPVDPTVKKLLSE